MDIKCHVTKVHKVRENDDGSVEFAYDDPPPFFPKVVIFYGGEDIKVSVFSEEQIDATHVECAIPLCSNIFDDPDNHTVCKECRKRL